MIELLFIILFISMNIVAYNSNIYSVSLYDSISISVIFFIIIRLFNFYLNNKLYSQNKKALRISLVFIFMLFEGFLGVLYFLHYFDDILWLRTTIEVFINLSIFFVFLFIKDKDIRERKSYGNVYLGYQIVDIIAVFLLFITNILIHHIPLKYSIVSTLMISLMCLDFFINIYINKKKPYWYHKKVLFTYFDIIIQTNKLDLVLKEPLERVVSNDYILSESRYIMDYSFMRFYALNEIIKVFYDKCRQHGMKNTDSIKYTILLGILLMTNLMKRQFDFVVMPTFIVNPLQFIVRKIRYSLKRS